jgi:ABC-type glycerol-3-phosphate transport system substrate-binding protein
MQASDDTMKIGFPQPNWPGVTEYIDVLSVYIQNALAGKMSAKEALDKAAKEWEALVNKLGREEQRRYYADFVKSAKELGYW